MADLLTHVLVPFIVFTVLRWRFVWIERQWVPVAMGGAAVPDLVKVGIVVDDSMVEGAIGVPFSWSPIGTLGGLLVLAAAIAVWFGEDRRRVYTWIVVGGLSALVLDGLRAYADGFSGFWFYPLWWRPPTPSLYVSSDLRVTAVAVMVAALVLIGDRWMIRRDASDRRGGP